MDVEHFIGRWTDREGGAERANYTMFLAELCDVLGVPRPDPADATTANNDYVFERAVKRRESESERAASTLRIDLYKRGCFILEAKQSRLPGKGKALEGQLSLAGLDVEQPAERPLDPAAIARSFKRGGKRIEQRVAQVLATLARYGRVVAPPNGTCAARRAA